MAEFPFTGNISRNDLERYAPSNRVRTSPYSAGGEQQLPTPYSAQLRGLGVAGLGVAGAAGLYGGTKLTGNNPWNYIHSGFRLAEDYSPGQIFRTFQLGNFASQFADTGLAPRSFSAEQIADLSHTKWFDDLLHRAGPTAAKASTHGLQFTDGQLRAGPHLLLDNARAMSITGEPHLAVAYSRSTGFSGIKEVGAAKGFTKPVKEMLGEGVYFTGGASRGRALFNQLHAIGTETLTGRVNRLAAAPFELEPLKTIAQRSGDFFQHTVGFRPSLTVEAGAMLPTLGRMAKKWGGIGTAGYLGYQTADWAVRNFSLLNATPFDEGITAGIATAGVKLNTLAAKTADFIPGVRSYQEFQEEAAPGSTSLTKLAAFPLMGALAGMSATYAIGTFERTKQLSKNLGTGMDMSSALTKADSFVIEESERFAKGSFLGKAIARKYGHNRVPLFGALSKTKLWSTYGAVAAAALALPFLPGALIPGKTGDELEAIYSGEKEVAIRKGRWWELGRTPYEGTSIEYFRPHWYQRMLQGSTRKSMHGDDEPTPIGEWITENFTYGFEKKHYKDRPYPLTGTAFEDIPIVGPVLAATIGRIFKPPKLMHTEEWLSGSDGSIGSRQQLEAANRQYTEQTPVKRIQERYGEQPRFEMGEIPKGTPVDPNKLHQVFGEQAYRLTELSGLVGFTFSSLKGMITGEEEFFGQEERLQSARRAYSAERSYWDKSIGGGLGTTEFFRRLYPHRRRQIPEYNPIRNTMPDWMPGPGQKSPDFQHGDPFVKIKEGELRLPGAGFAARFPELEGVDPADYPSIYRYKILADIAPYSSHFDVAENAAKRDLSQGRLSAKQTAVFMQIQEQIKERNESKNDFFEYDVLRDETSMGIPGAEQSVGVLSLVNENLRAQEQKRGTISSVIGGYWEALIAGAQNPIEALSPLAPASKFIALETAMEKYKRTEVYGPEVAFWQDPVKNFILPFLRESGDMLGVEAIPGEVGKRRQIEEYFDILKYVKNKRLAEGARDEGVVSAAGLYERAAQQTTVGVNPYTRNFSNIFRSMPRSDRDYFTAFSQAKTTQDRTDILKMVPASQRRLYQAQWELSYAEQINTMLEEGKVPGNLREQAITEIARVFDKGKSEGLPVNQGLLEQYRDNRQEEESYGDWFKRTILIPEATADAGGLPGPDWVGWHPGVDLNDIKLKMVKAEGMDIHDFDLWESDERTAMHREYLDDAAHDLQQVSGVAPNRSPREVERELRSLMAELKITGNVHVSALDSSEQSYTITVDATEDRRQELRRELREAGY